MLTLTYFISELRFYGSINLLRQAARLAAVGNNKRQEVCYLQKSYVKNMSLSNEWVCQNFRFALL